MIDRLLELAKEPEGSMERAIADHLNEDDLHLQSMKESRDEKDSEA